MRIGINARLLLKNKLEGVGWHAYELIRRLVRLRSQDQFYLFYDRQDSILVPDSTNCIPVVISPVSRHPILLWWWTNYSLKKALQENNIDLYYSPEPILPLGLSIPGIITVHDISPLVHPEYFRFDHRYYYQQILQKNIINATAIIAVSEFTKTEIIKFYNKKGEDIHVVYNAAREIFSPISEAEKRSIQLRINRGNPYIVSIGSINPRKNVDLIIKAFDAFKSTYQTAHQLLIIGRRMGSQVLVNNALKESPFKDHIRLLGYIPDPEIASILAAADVLINLSTYEGFGMQLVEAFQSGVPVIASNLSCYPEIGSDAARLISLTDQQQQSNALHEIIQNPEKNKSNGITRAKNFRWEDSAQKISTIFSFYAQIMIHK